MTDLRIGLLGAARITPAAMIAPARLVDNVQVVAVAARDVSKAQIFATTHDVPQVLRSYEDLISSPDVDMVYNALPISLHAEWTIKAARAGKHILSEKPFAMTLEEAEAMNAAGVANNVRVIEALHYRYHPAFQKCVEWVRSDRIGDVTDIETEFSAHIPNENGEIRHQKALGGGAMFDLGCYPLSWALNIMPQNLEHVTATASLTATNVDEVMEAELTFEGGATARIRSAMAEGTPRHSYLNIDGTRGHIRFENSIFPTEGGRLTLVTDAGEVEADIDPDVTFTHQLRAVVAAIQSGVELLTEGAATLRQQRALDAVHKAAGIDVMGT